MHIKILSLFWWFALAGLFTLLFVEMLQLSPVLSWFGAINVSAFLSMGKDKASAKINTTRTPEATLLLLGLAGGFPGILTGRKLFNHKTTKTGFIFPMWGLFAVQLALSAYFFNGLEVLGFKKQPSQHKTSIDTQK